MLVVLGCQVQRCIQAPIESSNNRQIDIELAVNEECLNASTSDLVSRNTFEQTSTSDLVSRNMFKS
jgi:hypothetical protein